MGLLLVVAGTVAVDAVGTAEDVPDVAGCAEPAAVFRDQKRMGPAAAAETLQQGHQMPAAVAWTQQTILADQCLAAACWLLCMLAMVHAT